MDAMYGYGYTFLCIEHCREGIGDRLKVSNANEGETDRVHRLASESVRREAGVSRHVRDKKKSHHYIVYSEIK